MSLLDMSESALFGATVSSLSATGCIHHKAGLFPAWTVIGSSYKYLNRPSLALMAMVLGEQ